MSRRQSVGTVKQLHITQTVNRDGRESYQNLGLRL
jgi:hypothetical protein